MIWPAEIYKGAIAIVGKTGSGKTYTAKGALENILRAGSRACILDPTGAWWGLKSSADGKSAGFPVVVFGGDHADIDIADTAGEALGKLVAAKPMQCVVDISLMSMSGKTRFVRDFLEALYHDNRGPIYLVLDEADLFAPQRPMPDQTVMLNRVEQIVRRGRIKGFRPWLVTQRPAELHKSVLSQAGTLIAMKLTAPQDRDAIGAWIDGQADRAEGKKVLAALPKQNVGQGYLWCPSADILEQVQFPKITTFDSSRTPEDGEEIAEPLKLAQVELAEIRAALAQVDEKEKGKGRNSPIADVSFDHAAALSLEYKRGFDAGYEKGYSAGNHVGCGSADAMVRYLSDQLPAAINDIINEAIGLRTAQEVSQEIDKPAPAKLTPEQERARFKDEWNKPAKFIPPAAPAKSNGQGGGAELRVLRVLAARSPARFSKAQWATLSGMKRTGGTWQTYVSRLRSAGYLDEREDGTVGLTVAGIKAAGHVERPRAGSVIEDWKNSLGSGPAKMIEELVRLHPNPMDRANLADRVGMTASGGTFQTYLSRLKTNGLIEIHGRKIKASETLFVDARH